MEKYLINLPGGKSIKYRVAQKTDTWILVEAVIDQEIMDFLNAIAIKETSVDSVPPQSAETQPTGEPTPTIAEPEPAMPAQEEAAETVAFTPEQVAAMKEVKAKLKLTDNEGLNPFIQEWSLYQGKDWTYLNGANIDNFIQYLNEKII